MAKQTPDGGRPSNLRSKRREAPPCSPTAPARPLCTSSTYQGVTEKRILASGVLKVAAVDGNAGQAHARAELNVGALGKENEGTRGLGPRRAAGCGQQAEAAAAPTLSANSLPMALPQAAIASTSKVAATVRPLGQLVLRNERVGAGRGAVSLGWAAVRGRAERGGAERGRGTGLRGVRRAGVVVAAEALRAVVEVERGNLQAGVVGRVAGCRVGSAKVSRAVGARERERASGDKGR